MNSRSRVETVAEGDNGGEEKGDDATIQMLRMNFKMCHLKGRKLSKDPLNFLNEAKMSPSSEDEGLTCVQRGQVARSSLHRQQSSKAHWLWLMAWP